MKCASYNTQRLRLEESEINGVDLSDRDIIFLQRCLKETAEKLSHKFKLHMQWTPATDADSDTGLCVLSREKVICQTDKVGITINPKDLHQCDRYQSFSYAGIDFVNFLPPFVPRDQTSIYLDYLLKRDFDMAVGDAHDDWQNKNFKHSVYQVVNSKKNFSHPPNLLCLTWVLCNNTIKLKEESVYISDPQKMQRHFPIFFEITQK